MKKSCRTHPHARMHKKALWPRNEFGRIDLHNSPARAIYGSHLSSASLRDATSDSLMRLNVIDVGREGRDATTDWESAAKACEVRK